MPVGVKNNRLLPWSSHVSSRTESQLLVDLWDLSRGTCVGVAPGFRIDKGVPGISENGLRDWGWLLLA